MTISKKEITSLVDKSYSRLLRRILTAFILQSAISYDLESGNLESVETILFKTVRPHLKRIIEIEEEPLNEYTKRRLSLFLDSVTWKALSKKYCKNIITKPVQKSSK